MIINHYFFGISTRCIVLLITYTSIFFILNLEPSTGEFIVYGGTQLDTDQPLADYFYILDPETKTWSNRSLSTSDGAQGLGPRHSHAGI